MSVATVLITGAGGLVGSQAAQYYCERGATVLGIDNDMRGTFFGAEASTLRHTAALRDRFPSLFHHHATDIRDESALRDVFLRYAIDLIVHAAAQPSHDWAASDPLTDFSINAIATVSLLELMRLHRPEAVFVLLSSNKVYGDQVNALPLAEGPERFDLPSDHPYFYGINETLSIDATTHTIYGASKVSADIFVQEYGRYFGLKTGVLRAGCLTGSAHAGTRLHGFLSYLARCIVREEVYTVNGYGGKQVRDNLHAADVVTAVDAFCAAPRPGEVYNIGGGREGSLSVLEAIRIIEELSGKRAMVRFAPEPRRADFRWHIHDMTKFCSHFPAWERTYDARSLLEEIVRNGHFEA